MFTLPINGRSLKTVSTSLICQKLDASDRKYLFAEAVRTALTNARPIKRGKQQTMQPKHRKCQERDDVAPRRRHSAQALLVASALLLTACGGGGDQPAPGPDPGPQPQPEPQPPPAALAPAAQEARSGAIKLLRASTSNSAANATTSESARHRLTRGELTP